MGPIISIIDLQFFNKKRVGKSSITQFFFSKKRTIKELTVIMYAFEALYMFP